METRSKWSFGRHSFENFLGYYLQAHSPGDLKRNWILGAHTHCYCAMWCSHRFFVTKKFFRVTAWNQLPFMAGLPVLSRPMSLVVWSAPSQNRLFRTNPPGAPDNHFLRNSELLQFPLPFLCIWLLFWFQKFRPYSLRLRLRLRWGLILHIRILCSNQWPQYCPGWDRIQSEIVAHSWAKRSRHYSVILWEPFARSYTRLQASSSWSQASRMGLLCIRFDVSPQPMAAL